MQSSDTIINTDNAAKDGQNKCPKCGSTDISLNVSDGKLRCNFCRHEFEPQHVEMQSDLANLHGQVMGSGASNINNEFDNIVTLKCESCGAEVVVDTSSATQSRCHWCRNTLSINKQIPNGAIPDVVLPFGITKEEAQKEIEKFVRKRKFFAHPKFKKEFTTENIMGVYLPYMLVDLNSHVNLEGQGEILKRTYSVNDETYYDADLYSVKRDYDLVIEGLTVESSKDKLNNSSNKTNNVINAIMPFDLENCVKFNANYLKGYSSEKRDTNIDDLKSLVDYQSKNVAKYSANQTIRQYNRGVAWQNIDFKVIGVQWKSAYLPVWLYSYLEVKGKEKILHYVAVNARTKETMGSVPIHMPVLILVSIIVEIIGIFLMLNIDFEYNWLFSLLGIVYFVLMFLRYRNSDARHNYESETKTKLNNLNQENHFIEHRTRLRNSMMNGANNVNQNFGEKLIDNVINQNEIASFLKNNLKK